QPIPPIPPIQLAARDRSVQPGELVVLTITAPAAVDRVQVKAFGHDIAPYRADDRGWRALVGIDLDVKPGTYPVVVTGSAGARATYDLVVRPRAFRTRRLTVNEAF